MRWARGTLLAQASLSGWRDPDASITLCVAKACHGTQSRFVDAILPEGSPCLDPKGRDVRLYGVSVRATRKPSIGEGLLTLYQ